MHALPGAPADKPLCSGACMRARRSICVLKAQHAGAGCCWRPGKAADRHVHIYRAPPSLLNAPLHTCPFRLLQVVMELEQQARELQMVIDGLEAASSDGDSASLLPLLGTSLSGGLGGSNTLPPLAAAAPGGSLAAVPAALLRAVASATAAQPQRSIAAGAAVGRLHGGGLGWPTAQGAGSGGSSGGAGSGPAAPGAAPGPYQKRAHDPASCTAPNCRLCAYEQRLQQRAGQPKAGGQQQPLPPFLQPAALTQQQQQQQQPHPPGLPAAELSGLPLGSDHSDIMAKAVLEATGLLEEAGLASGGLSAPLLDALLHNLPSMPTLLPHPPPS